MRNKIITELYNSPQLKEIINRAASSDLRDDLKSELMVVLCELREARLIEMYSRGELIYYICQVASNMMSSPKNKFGKTYRQQFEDVEDTEEVPEDKEERLKQERLADEVVGFIEEKLSWHDAEMVKAYLKFGSYRNVYYNIGIPKATVHISVSKTFKKIKQALEEKK